MTPEQQRELWLKRILPALVILVLYFVIISPYFVTDKTKKAEARYLALKKKGIDAAALPRIAQQQSAISVEIAELEREDKAMHEVLTADSIFLSQSRSPNDELEQIAVILANNHLQVLDEKRNDKPGNEVLPKSLRETRYWLKDILSVEPPAATKATTAAAVPAGKKTEDKDLNIWTIHYIGSYLDSYRALSVLIDEDIKALPVSLTMQASKSNLGKQEWLLTLWL
ncbi:MAG: hypothetical protein WCP96_06915 [Methylococcaceae bacterium]